MLFLFLKFDYVFLLPIRERLYLLRHCFWQAGHAILSFVCFFFRLMSDERPRVQCELTEESVFDFYCQIAIYLRIHFA